MIVVGRGEGNVQFTRSYVFSSAISMNTFIRVRKFFIVFIVVVVFWKYTHLFLDFFYKTLKIRVNMILSFSHTHTCDKK